jgi:hypothetical protein
MDGIMDWAGSLIKHFLVKKKLAIVEAGQVYTHW